MWTFPGDLCRREDIPVEEMIGRVAVQASSLSRVSTAQSWWSRVTSCQKVGPGYQMKVLECLIVSWHPTGISYNLKYKLIQISTNNHFYPKNIFILNDGFEHLNMF